MITLGGEHVIVITLVETTVTPPVTCLSSRQILRQFVSMCYL
jgi:hypothetical protein